MLWRGEVGWLAPSPGNGPVQPHTHSWSRYSHNHHHGGHSGYECILKAAFSPKWRDFVCVMVSHSDRLHSSALQLLRGYLMLHISATWWPKLVWEYSQRRAPRWFWLAPTTGLKWGDTGCVVTGAFFRPHINHIFPFTLQFALLPICNQWSHPEDWGLWVCSVSGIPAMLITKFPGKDFSQLFVTSRIALCVWYSTERSVIHHMLCLEMSVFYQNNSSTEMVGTFFVLPLWKITVLFVYC